MTEGNGLTLMKKQRKARCVNSMVTGDVAYYDGGRRDVVSAAFQEGDLPCVARPPLSLVSL